MIYRTGETIKFAAFYTAAGIAKSGLSVVANVMRLGDDTVIACEVHEDGLGFYSCTFAARDEGLYVCRFAVDDEDVEEKQIAAAAWYGLGISKGTSSTLPAVFDLSTDEFAIFMEQCARKKMELFCGDSLRLEITVFDAHENPFDLSDCEAIFAVKIDVNDEAFVIRKSLDLSEGAEGKIVLALTATETTIEAQNYVGEIELRFANGEVRTIWHGVFAVKKGLI